MGSDKVAKREGRGEGGYRAVCKGGVWGVVCAECRGNVCASAGGVHGRGRGPQPVSACLPDACDTARHGRARAAPAGAAPKREGSGEWGGTNRARTVGGHDITGSPRTSGSVTSPGHLKCLLVSTLAPTDQPSPPGLHPPRSYSSPPCPPDQPGPPALPPPCRLV